MTKADSAEDFRDAWEGHINELYKMGHSLPDDKIDEFMDDVEAVEEYIDIAAEHSFED